MIGPYAHHGEFRLAIEEPLLVQFGSLGKQKGCFYQECQIMILEVYHNEQLRSESLYFLYQACLVSVEAKNPLGHRSPGLGQLNQKPCSVMAIMKPF